jgi:hypothetical protein
MRSYEGWMYVPDSENMDTAFFMDVGIYQKIVPGDRFSNLTQTHDISILFFNPKLCFDADLQIEYINRKWILEI